MLDFMIIGLPRSGTTWASNWLTTDASHCVHDPLYETHYTKWDTDERFGHGRGLVTGASCTGVWRWARWVNDHPARKLVLLRPEEEVNRSLRLLGLPEMDIGSSRVLQSVNGLHVPHTWLFNTETARELWAYLMPGAPFNALRHQELMRIEMQPNFYGLSTGPEVTRRLMDELNWLSNH